MRFRPTMTGAHPSRQALAMNANPLRRPLHLGDLATQGASLLDDAADLAERHGVAQDPDGARWILRACQHVRRAAAWLPGADRETAAVVVARCRGILMAVEEQTLDARGRRDSDLLLDVLEVLRLLRYATERVLADLLGGSPVGGGATPDVSSTAAADLAERLARRP